MLAALAEQLAERGERYDLVVIGGSALAALGLVDRTTNDVDVPGVLADRSVVSVKVLPAALEEARNVVADDFGVPREWCPTDLVEFGLPSGFVSRVESIAFGDSLVVHVASRYDQIHFKLYAAADGRAARHEADLHALSPTPDELLDAARWTRTQDFSEGFRGELLATLRRFGVDVDDITG